MKEFRKYTLEELIDSGDAKLQTGPFGTMLKAREYVDAGVPVIAVQDIGNNRLFEDNIVYVHKDTAERLSRYKVQSGDIVFGRKGAVDRRALIREKESGWIQGSDCIRLRLSDNIDSRFLSYQLGSPILKSWILGNAHGTTMPSLNQDILKRMPLVLPPLPVQKKIAAILSSLDDKIELNTRMNNVLEEIARALFNQWFVEFEFPNAEGKPYKSAGGKMVESEMGMVPEGWEIRKFGDMVTILKKTLSPGKSPSQLFEHYSIPVYDERKFPVFERGEEIKSVKYVITKDCILISKLNPSTKRIWRPYCITDNAICSTEFIVYLPNNQEYKDYLYSIVDSRSFLDYLKAHVTGSTGSRQRVMPRATLSYTLALPPEKIIKDICDILRPIYEICQQKYLENENLMHQRDALLPKLMNGEIRV